MPRCQRDAALDSSSPADAADDSSPDDATTPDADLDATLDASDQDATIDADTPDASDASTAPDADADAPLACTLEDQATWRAFHLSGEVVPAVGECLAANAISCSKGMCPLDDCLREKAHVSTCEDCVSAEIQCLFAHCKADCGANDTDDTCRACACRNNCIAAFDSCAGEPLDVCADCNETTCANVSFLSPELIMVVVSPLL